MVGMRMFGIEVPAMWLLKDRLGFDALYALIVDTGIDGMDFIFAPAPHG